MPSHNDCIDLVMTDPPCRNGTEPAPIASQTQVTEVALAAKVAFLRQPSSFPEPTARVDVIETHMSWVFLIDGFVYKLKKPVRYPLLDFSTLRQRMFYCNEEIRLNRPLAQPVYLGVVALTADAAGHLALDGRGDVVDWLVKMRRLPVDAMLDQAIANGSASRADMSRIAERLVAFYRQCPTVAIEPSAYHKRLRREISANRHELSARCTALSMEHIGRIGTMQLSFLQGSASLFDERAARAHIVEGHGDLRPEHICLQPEVWIIDRLEFSRRLRIVDTADEIGFLALECERLGAPRLAADFLQACREISGDAPPPSLIHFYQSHRACVRANIALRHLDEEQFRDSPKWPRRAQEYLKLAEQHALLITDGGLR